MFVVQTQPDRCTRGKRTPPPTEWRAESGARTAGLLADPSPDSRSEVRNAVSNGSLSPICLRVRGEVGSHSSMAEPRCRRGSDRPRAFHAPEHHSVQPLGHPQVEWARPPSAMALTVGDRLGHYDVTALIGEGGMGQDYQATDTQLGRDVALRIISWAGCGESLSYNWSRSQHSRETPSPAAWRCYMGMVRRFSVFALVLTLSSLGILTCPQWSYQFL